MRKTYSAPSVERLFFCSLSAFTADDVLDRNGSEPWNDGELGWT